MTGDPRVDAYIAEAREFARPILAELRARVHRALPDAAETIKWRMPHFTIAGKNVAGMAAFNAHCAFVIHGEGRQGGAMGQYGRITTVAELPPERELAAKLREASARIAALGTAAPRRAEARGRTRSRGVGASGPSKDGPAAAKHPLVRSDDGPRPRRS